MDRLPWWSPGTTSRDMRDEISECISLVGVSGGDGMARFAHWTAVESIQPLYLRLAIDAVYFASVDEGCIPAGRLEEHEYQQLLDSWD